MKNINMGKHAAVESNVKQAMEYVNEVCTFSEETFQLIKSIICYGYCALYGIDRFGYFQALLSDLGLTNKQIERIAKYDFPEKVTIPVDVAITRHYRTHVECYDDADEASIRKKAIQEIVECQEGILTPDPDLDIEEGDVTWIHVDFDGVQEA